MSWTFLLPVREVHCSYFYYIILYLQMCFHNSQSKHSYYGATKRATTHTQKVKYFYYIIVIKSINKAK
jgi:hypothetical protein